MAKMRPPLVPDPETPVLRKEQITKLFKVCDGRDLMSRRDTAMISLLLDTGIAVRTGRTQDRGSQRGRPRGVRNEEGPTRQDRAIQPHDSQST